MDDIKPIKLVVIPKEQLSNSIDNPQSGNSLAGTAGNLSNGIAYYALFNYFDLGSGELMDKQKTDQLNIIYNWAMKKAQSNSIEGVIRAIRQAENRIGMPRIGESRFNHIYNYVKIDSQISEMEQQRNSMEGLIA